MTERERVARLLHRIECEEAGATEQEIRTWWERCDQDLYLSRADRVLAAVRLTPPAEASAPARAVMGNLDIAGARDVFPDTVTTLNVAHCSRCGDDHEVTFHRLLESVEIEGKRYHWEGVCARTGLPVFMRIVEKP